MSFCPNCKAEYREGFTICSECQETLVDVLPEESSMAYSYDISGGRAHLLTVTDSMEGDIIEAFLHSHGIPVERKYRDCGGYLSICMNTPNLPIDLFVPAIALEDAKALLAADGDFSIEPFTANEAFETEGSVFSESNLLQSEFSDPLEVQKKAKLRRIMTWISILLFAPGALVILIVLILQFFLSL